MDMTPSEMMDVLQSKNRMLTDKNEEYKDLAEKRANAKRDYNVEYARQLLVLKSQGTPITIAKEVCKGNRAVADLKFTYEVAAAIEKACLESMKDIREAIGAARSILTWFRNELQSQ